MPCLYRVGQMIEYSNGCTAVVVWVDDEEYNGGHHFIIESDEYAACWGYTQNDEEVWCFVFEDDNTWRDDFCEALNDISASIVTAE